MLRMEGAEQRWRGGEALEADSHCGELRLEPTATKGRRLVRLRRRSPHGQPESWKLETLSWNYAQIINKYCSSSTSAWWMFQRCTGIDSLIPQPRSDLIILPNKPDTTRVCNSFLLESERISNMMYVTAWMSSSEWSKASPPQLPSTWMLWNKRERKRILMITTTSTNTMTTHTDGRWQLRRWWISSYRGRRMRGSSSDKKLRVKHINNLRDGMWHVAVNDVKFEQKLEAIKRGFGVCG